jgi:hypothetical protein
VAVANLNAVVQDFREAALQSRREVKQVLSCFEAGAQPGQDQRLPFAADSTASVMLCVCELTPRVHHCSCKGIMGCC